MAANNAVRGTVKKMTNDPGTDVLQLLLDRMNSLDRNLDAIRVDLKSKIEILDKEVTDIDHKINGNGQPGFIANINREIQEIKDQRGEMEKKMMKFAGAGTFVVCFVCFFTGSGPVGLSSILTLMGVVAR